MKKQIIQLGIAALISFGAAFLLGWFWKTTAKNEARRLYEQMVAALPAPDTIVVRDTLVFEGPALLQKIVLRDTIRIQVTVPGDPYPVAVEVPAERIQRLYEDAGFRAWISGPSLQGVGPELDSIRLFNTTQIIEKPVPVPGEPRRPLRVGVEGFATVWPSKEATALAYGPAGYIKYKGDVLEIKIRGGYDFGTRRGAVFEASAALDILKF